jgi:hypothetical protein
MLDPFDHPPSQVPALETTSGDAADTLPAKPAAAQFRIRDLMIATAVFAVYLALAKAFGIWSLLVAYWFYFAARVFVQSRPKFQTAGVQLSLDLMAGAFLPIGCIVFDPMVFQTPTPRVIGLVTIGSQIAMLCSWMFVAPLIGPSAFSFTAGYLLFGACFAGLIGVCLLPLSIIGLFAIIGLLGFIPFSTAKTYFRHARKANAFGIQRNNSFAMLGFFVALAIPFIAGGIARYVPAEWLKPINAEPFGNWNNVD